MKDIYNIDGIISKALRGGIDISPSDRLEWKMFCCSLKVLGYDENTFVTLSSGDERDSRKAWRAEGNPRRYRNEDQAKAMIVSLAKNAGMDVKQFLLSRCKEQSTRQPESAPTQKQKRTVEQEDPPKPVEYIPMSVVNAMAGRARETSLYMWLCRYFAPADVDLVFAMYRVGASKYINSKGGRAVSFPYMPDAEHCIDCRITHIDPVTGSRKNADPLRKWINKDGIICKKEITWALAEMKKSDLRAPWCNFGDHLLSMRPDAKVCIVESEKSAIILSLAYPDQIWIAVGGKDKLNTEKIKACRGRKVTIFPDRDGYKAWREKSEELAQHYDISLDTTILKYKGDKNDDFADIVIRSLEGMQTTPVEPTPQPQPQVQLSPDEKQALELWAQFQANNPHLSEFADALSLRPKLDKPKKTTNHGEDKQ